MEDRFPPDGVLLGLAIVAVTGLLAVILILHDVVTGQGSGLLLGQLDIAVSSFGGA